MLIAFALAPVAATAKDKAVEIFSGSANVSPVPDELEQPSPVGIRSRVPAGAPEWPAATRRRSRSWPSDVEERTSC
jgi:hypothetical protein